MDWLPELGKGTTPTSENRDLPTVIQRAGDAGERAWDDFFSGIIANDLTRVAYNRAVRYFLEWPKVKDKKLHEITAADVGEYINSTVGLADDSNDESSSPAASTNDIKMEPDWMGPAYIDLTQGPSK